MKFHKAASIFPLMEGQEFEDLKRDIARNGLIEPIWLHPDDSILDGRNRYLACKSVGVNPQFRNWNGKEGDEVSFVISLNLERRHLDSSQRACIAADAEGVMKVLEDEAKERQLAGLKQGDTLPVVEKIPQREQLKTRDKAAALFGTNARYYQDAKKLKTDEPELFEQAKAGQITISKAKRRVNKKNKKDPLPISGKYKIFYADPPWKYNDSGLDDYGHAERHYPPMTIKEICKMGNDIKEACEKDAVLFLWVTSPFLEVCFRVIKAWGFRYKTSFVWDKIKHNYGHYNSVRHEFLLICTKGSCTPEITKLFDSVQSIERSKKHSEKPPEFRQIINTLYPVGNRIELFARVKSDGWETWGNE